jgi:hypothetical protein
MSRAKTDTGAKARLRTRNGFEMSARTEFGTPQSAFRTLHSKPSTVIFDLRAARLLQS